MKKILIICTFISVILSASNNYELSLYEKVLPTIFIKTPIRVFVDKEMEELLKHSDKFKIVHTCNKSIVILIGNNFSNLPEVCKDKPFFTTSYKSFKNDENSFGAFYWRKGRPQIRFKKHVVDRYNLKLPYSLKKYIK